MKSFDNSPQGTTVGFYPTGGDFAAPNLRNWASEIDQGTIRQAEVSARLPILAGPVALMPDAHIGYGVTVGSVIATAGAIIPSAVGVDIGCGMLAGLTNLTAKDLPDDLAPILQRIARAVPAGVGRGHQNSTTSARTWFDANGLPEHFTPDQRAKTVRQFGTLGSGNHFAEISLDETQRVWIVLHSGSRGIGNEIATTHIKNASRDFADVVEGVRLEDRDLAWLVEGTPAFQLYAADLSWLQDYALGNRRAMFDAMAAVLFRDLGHGQVDNVIQAHHNYAVTEKHLVNGVNKDVWVTRKGAIRAFKGDLGIIPGSMGTDTYIVEGLGNPLSWCSCSHGAGRRMSRTQAKMKLTAASLTKAMGSRAWLAGDAARLVDEHPAAYKSIEAVMADQADLVKPKHCLTAVLNYKG